MTVQVLPTPNTSTTDTNASSPTTMDLLGSSTGSSNTNKKLTPYHDNSSDVLPIRVTVSDPDFENQIKEAAMAMCPFLKLYSELTVTPLGGGLSNELFIVQGNNTMANQDTPQQRQEDTKSSVLVRIQPTNNTENNLPAIVDRDVENAISAWLSSQQVGPMYYGRFQNGRVEEFYPNHEPLSWKDMSRVGPSMIAPIMAHFHSLQVPATVLPRPDNDNDDNNQQHQGDIFVRVREWMTMAETLCSENATTKPRASAMLKQLQQDWKWLEEAFQQTSDNKNNATSPAQHAAQQLLQQIVFTHMDMQSLNLLRDTTATVQGVDPDSTIKVIDFEYAGFNPRAMDMANTFCEHCDMNNMQADYATQYPSDAVQNAFVRNYVMHTATATDDWIVQTVLAHYVDEADFLDTARLIIGRYTLVSHLSWAIWSVVQSFMSDIAFDYIEYANHRRDGFVFMKQKCFGSSE